MWPISIEYQLCTRHSAEAKEIQERQTLSLGSKPQSLILKGGVRENKYVSKHNLQISWSLPLGLNQRGSKPTRHPGRSKAHLLQRFCELHTNHSQGGPSCSTVSSKPKGSCPALPSSLCARSLLTATGGGWAVNSMTTNTYLRQEGRVGLFLLCISLSIRGPFKTVRVTLLHQPELDHMPFPRPTTSTVTPGAEDKPYLPQVYGCLLPGKMGLCQQGPRYDGFWTSSANGSTWHPTRDQLFTFKTFLWLQGPKSWNGWAQSEPEIS